MDLDLVVDPDLGLEALEQLPAENGLTDDCIPLTCTHDSLCINTLF